MDDADLPSAAAGGEPGVLGRLPTTRPQHRSARRAGTAAAAVTTPAGGPSTGTGPTPRRRSAAKPVAAEPTAAPASPPTVPAVPAPPPAPRSGWATPEPDHAPSTPLPPLVALADGAVRTGAQLVRGILRRLPRG